MRLCSAAADDSDAGDVWTNLAELTDAAIISAGYTRAEAAGVLGIPLSDLAHALGDGGSVALADRVARLLEIRISDLTWMLKDLRATRDSVAAHCDRLTREVWR